MLKIVVDSVGTKLQMRTFDMGVSLYLGAVYVQHLEYKGKCLSVDLSTNILYKSSPNRFE